MLYLGEGVLEVTVGDEGEERTIQVFPDFSDPTRFYYLPNFPHVAKMEDGTPAIRLLVFRENLDEIEEGDEEATAFLSLDVDVSWDPDLLDDAAGALRLQNGLMEKPELTPIFYREGSVKLMLLDAVTPEEGASPGEDVETEFVTDILGTGSPSLYGDNRAIFQAVLSKKGAAALSAALDGVTPIGVVYSLTFAGLQPAFNLRATVDWKKVYDHFSEKENLNLLFYEKEIQRSVDKLIDDKVIDIEFTQEGIGAEGMESQAEQAMDTVRQMVFDKFFEATLKKETAAGDSASDQVVDTLTSLARNATTLGVGYSYQRKEVKVEELRTLTIDWTARKATERKIYPQAHMYNLLTEGGVTEEQLVTIVDGGADIWRTLPFQVLANAAWESDGIAGITVDIEYDDADSGATRSWSTHLNAEKPSDQHRDWMDRTSGNAFRYRYEVVFAAGSVPGPSIKLSSGDEWIEHTGTVLTISPNELYEAVELEVAPSPNFPFDRWPAVQAAVRYTTDDGFQHMEDGILKAATDTVRTRFRVNKGSGGIREVSLTHLGAEGDREATGWMPMEQDQWVVTDPRDDKLEVRAVVAGDRGNIANLIVDLEYTDPDNGIHDTATLQFDSENVNQPQMHTFHLEDPTKRRYRYRMTLVTKDGDFMETGWISTDAPTLPVGEVYVKRMNIEVITGELDSGIEGVEVKLVYDDEDNGLHEEETFELGSDSRAEWQFDIQDPAKRGYQATITWKREDGFDQSVGPTMTTNTLLVVPPGPPD